MRIGGKIEPRGAALDPRQCDLLDVSKPIAPSLIASVTAWVRDYTLNVSVDYW